MSNLQELHSKARSISAEVQKVIVGKNEIIEKLLLGIMAKGHILLEDIPGVGKTTMALGFSKALSLRYQRLQFTPDVMPGDVTGFNVYNKDKDSFTFKPGAAFCNLFLADEINRTSSKTQSALLEVMEEGKVTVDGVTRVMPRPYTVIATQNPIGSVGTQMLPESQLDRFMIRLSMGYPDIGSEINILKGKQNADPLTTVNPVVTSEEIIAIQDACENVFVHEEIYTYIANLIYATRTNTMLDLGASPRGTIASTSMAKARAFLSGRNFVIPDDVQHIFADVVSHRVILSPRARVNSITVETVLNEIISETAVPELSKEEYGRCVNDKN